MSDTEDTHLQSPMSSHAATTKIVYTPDELIALEDYAVLPADTELPDRAFYRFDATVVMKMNHYIHNAGTTTGSKRNNYKKNQNAGGTYSSRLKEHYSNHNYSYGHASHEEEDTDETPEWMAETDFKVDPDFQLYMKSGAHTTDEFEREKKMFHSKRNSGITGDERHDNGEEEGDNLQKELQKQLEEPEILGPTEQEYYQQLAEQEKVKEKAPEPTTIKTNAGDFQFGLELESKKEKDNNFFNSLLKKTSQVQTEPVTRAVETTPSTSTFLPPSIQRTSSQILPPGLVTSPVAERSFSERTIPQQNVVLPPGMLSASSSHPNLSSMQTPNQNSQLTPEMQLQQMKQMQIMQQMQQMQQLQRIQQLQQLQRQQQQGGGNAESPQQLNPGMQNTNLNQIPPHLLQNLMNSNQHSPQIPPGMQGPVSLNNAQQNRNSNIVPMQMPQSPQESRQGSLQSVQTSPQLQQQRQIPIQIQQHMQQQQLQLQQQMQNLPPHIQQQLQQNLQLQQQQQLQQLQLQQQQQPSQQPQPQQQRLNMPMQMPMMPMMPMNLPPPDQLPLPLREKFFQIQQALVHFQQNGQQPPPVLLHDMMELHKVIQAAYGRLGNSNTNATLAQSPSK